MLPPDIEEKDLLTAILAVKLANYYIPPIIWAYRAAPNEVFIRGDLLDKGMAVFVAANILYDIYGVDGYNMYKKYQEWFTGRLSLGCLSPVYFCFDMSTKFYMLETIIGRDVFWEALRQYIRDFRYGFPTKRDLIEYFSKQTDMNVFSYFNAFYDTSRTIDYNIKSVKMKKQKGNYIVEGTIENLGNWSIPVEIGFVVNYSDTIYDTLIVANDSLIPPYCTFKRTLPKRPRAVVVDPNHERADSNRKNNYYLMTPMKFRYYPPSGLFPGIEPRDF